MPASTQQRAGAPPPALPFGLVAAWAAPAVPVYFAAGLVQIYFLKFGTDVLHVAPGALGLVLGLARLWDAAASPVVGFLSDRTRHPLGRRRSWMLASALPIAATLVMVWAPPPQLAHGALLAWLALALLGFSTALACLELPRAALPVELSARSRDRTRMFATNGVAIAISSLIAFTLGIGALRTASDPRAAALALSGGLALLTVASIAWLAARLREPPGNLGRGGRSPLRAWGHVLRNPYQQRLMLSGFLNGLPMGAMGVLAPYLFEYTLGRPELTEAYMLAFFVPHLLSVPLWLGLARRFRKRSLLIASLVLAAATYSGMYAIFDAARSAPVAVPLLLLGPALLGIAMGCDMVVPPAIRAEVIDYDELLSGERKEGVYTAISGLVLKLGSAASVALAGQALEWSGFRVGVQNARVGNAILWAMTLIPAFCVALSIAPLARFRLTETEHARILGELEQRRALGA